MRILLALLAAAACVPAAEDGPARNPKPNFVFIMADDLGYGDLSCYGSKTISTPHLDALAESGLKLTDYHSNGAVCSPTRAALMTGKYQQRVGVPGVINARAMRHTGMDLAHRTIAEALKPHGYRTGLFGKWHLGYPASYNPTKQGFDEFRGFVSGNVDYHNHIDQAGYFDWWQQDELKDEPGYITDLISNHGVDFIRRQPAGVPFLLMLMHGAPHYPYQGRKTPGFRKTGEPSPRQSGVDIPPLYKEMIEVMDEGIGKVVAELDQKGLRDNTLVIFCSDNGPTKDGSTAGLRGLKGTVWEGGHRVPGIVSWPARIEAGRTSDATTAGFDWFPTFLAAAGAPVPEGLDGINLLPHLAAATALPERTLVWQHGGASAVREGPWKLVVPKRGKPELFNLAKDRPESHNLATAQPQRFRELREALATWETAVSSN